MDRIHKVWGWEDVIINNESYCAKILNVNPLWMCSLHYHPVKKETFYILEGSIRLERKNPDGSDDDINLFTHDTCTIQPKTPHRFWARRGEWAQILEISTPHSDADVVRLEPSREIPL